MSSGGRAATAIVVGGGIAGIAAALRLAEAGVAVTLLETRKKLGGRATSFTDVRTGAVIDNCQHVTMGCCVNYLDLLRRLGVGHKVRWLEESYWVEAGDRRSALRPGLLPPPGHFAGAFLGAKFLTPGEKFAVARAMASIVRTRRDEWRAVTFGQWLRMYRQPERVVRRFWEPVVISACNLPCERVAASVALHVFQEGFLATREGPRVGVASVPLIELYDPAEAAIVRAGGRLRLGASVERVGPRSVTLTGGESISAGAVICAVPPERASRLADDPTRVSDPRFDAMARATHSPILGVHMVFDRPVLGLHSAVLVERATQWVFRKDQEGRSLHAVISSAEDWMPLDEDEITRRVLDDLHACFPDSSRAVLLSSRPVKEKRATYAATPEIERLRPTTLGPLGRDGVILAGDFVQSGWPATMEGAARTGYMAAAAALGERPESGVLPSLPLGFIARTLAPMLAQG